MASAFQGAYNSFSGVDIKAVFGNKVLAELQAISYSVTREKAPVCTFGSADPRSFSRGKRGIAGTMIFIVFDRHAVLGTLGMMADEPPKDFEFWSDIDDLRPEFAKTSSSAVQVEAANAIRRDPDSTASGSIGANVTQQESILQTVGGDKKWSAAWFADQIMPFDITLAAANEYGAAAVMRIYGVEILNEGYGISVDDLQSAQQTTYVARTIVGWKPVNVPKNT